MSDRLDRNNRAITGSGMSSPLTMPGLVPYRWREREYPKAAAAVAETLRRYPRPAGRTGRYTVMLCRDCTHPGQLHTDEQPNPCRVCDCQVWVMGETGWWSDKHTERLLAYHQVADAQ